MAKPLRTILAALGAKPGNGAALDFPLIDGGPATGALRLARRTLIAALVAVNLVVAALLAYALGAAREQREQEVRLTLENVTLLVDHNITGAVNRIDIALREVVDELERELREQGQLGERNVDDLLTDRRAWVSGVAEFRVVDATGVFIYGRDVKPGAPVSIADHDHFIQHSRNPESGMLVSNPQEGRLIQGWMISFSRRYSRPDGSFAGIVSGAVPASYFAGQLAGINLGRQGIVVLRGGDTALIARQPPLADPRLGAGNKVISRELADIIASGANSAVYSTRQAGDQVERLNSFRRMSGLPFYVVAGMGVDDYLVQWRADVWKAIGIVVLFAAASGVSGWLLWRALYLTDRASQRSRILLRHSSDGVHILDAGHRLVEVSDSFCAMLGYSRAEMLGMHVTQWDAKYDSSEIAEFTSAGFRRNETYSLETRHRRKDGSMVEVEVTVRPLQLDGQPMLFNSARDITERKRSEEIRLSLEEQLHRSHKMEALGRMAGRIAHEISNALQPVMSHASLASHACAGNETAMAHLASIKEGVRHGREIIRSVLAIAGGRAVSRKDCALETEVAGIMRLIVAGVRPDIVVETDLEPTGGTVCLSASELFQIIENLVNNSADAIVGSGRIRVTTGPAELNVQDAAARGVLPGTYAELTVADTGVGMDEAALLRAFDPFFTTKPVNKGSGLGLSTVRSLVESMDGKIRILSAPGQGTMIRIVLPLTAA